MPGEPKHPFLFVVAATIIILALAGYLLWRASLMPNAASNPFARYFDTAFLSVHDGTFTWYDYENGALAAHAAPSEGNFAGLARAGSALYIAVSRFGTATTSSVYRYENGSYSAAFSDQTHGLLGLSVSADGAFFGFSEVGVDGESSDVADAAGKTVQLAQGISPVRFLSQNGIRAVLYVNGPTLYVRVFSGSVWQDPVAVHSSSPVTMFATDGGSRFAFVEPAQHTVQEWSITSMEPFAATPTAILPAVPGILAYGGGALFAYRFVPAAAHSVRRTLSAVDMGTGTTYSVALPSGLDASSTILLFSKSASL